MEQSADRQALLAVENRLVRAGERRIANGMTIDLDVSLDYEFGLLVRLAPHCIHSEAWAGADSVFSSADTGDHAWFALIPDEAARAATRLAAVGLSFEEVLRYRE